MTKTIVLSIIGITISLGGLFLFLNGEWWMFFSYLLSIVGFSFVVCACYDNDVDYSKKSTDIAKIVSMSIALFVSLYPIFCCFDWFVQVGGSCVSLLYGYNTYSETYEGGVIVLLASMFVALFFAYGITEIIKAMINERIAHSPINLEKREKEKEARIARSKILAEQREKERDKHKQEMAELTAKYGALTRVIEIPQSYYQSKSRILNSIMIFDTTNTIKIRKNILSYRDILNCSVVDNSTTSQTASTQTVTTTTDTGNMVGRAIVGGILTGGVGAVIGAATAKKNTTISSPQTNILVKHDYTIQINVNSITDSLIKIDIGSDEAKVNEIVSMLNVVISRNK